MSPLLAVGQIPKVNIKPTGKIGSFFKKQAKEVSDAVNDAAGGSHEKSILKKIKVNQNKGFPKASDKDTRFAIAGNLYIDVAGKYPSGFEPKWKFITYQAQIVTPYEDYINPTAALKSQRGTFAIGDYQGKAVLMFGTTETCDCYADIEIDEAAIISSKPQTFKVSNFTKIENLKRVDKKCAGNKYQEGGWEGRVTLSSNTDGDITMDLVIESYKSNLGKLLGVSYRFLLNNYQILNEMSPSKAEKIIADEIAAKKARKDFMEKSEKQIQALLAEIKKKHPKECRDCFSRNQDFGVDVEYTRKVYVSDGSYAGTDTDYNPTTTVALGNNCNFPIKIIGIQQKFSEEKGYYYEKVVKEFAANEKIENKQGILSYLFTSLVGMNGDFDISEKYCIECFRLGSIQWLKVVRQ
ncbi:hypothetical protein CHX27_10260 [Flavobacterium aurantiibacter]|uniref:Uncharacterized protein n=2 Tax=Flavobacterium aurantiibacter TaxID=2023067 RepID=A0A255ZPE0_9FLAO|nr:hypothetical protein CHX27_10260 [Flavobacterium aurantiibacter]